MGNIADIVIFGVEPFYYPAKIIEKGILQVCKISNLFSLYILDIPQFPVQGKILGSAHWKEIAVQNADYTVEVQLTRQANSSWKKVFNELSLQRRDQSLNFGLDVLKKAPKETSTRAKLLLRFPSKYAFDDILDVIRNSSSIADLQTKGEITENILKKEILYHDTSTGIVYDGADGIAHNGCFNLRLKGFGLLLGVPLYALLSIIYNLIKIIPTIIYLTAQIFIVYHSQKEEEPKTFNEIAWTHIKEMAFETGASFRNILRTPFFALGMFGGALIAIFSPLNGMKIAGSFEYHWNHRVSKFNPGCYCFFHPMRKFTLSILLVGGVYYLAPCLSPKGIVKVDHQGNILDDVTYFLPKDLANFKWNRDVKPNATIIAHKVDRTKKETMRQ